MEDLSARLRTAAETIFRDVEDSQDSLGLVQNLLFEAAQNLDRMRSLADSLRAVLPYAESRVEDMLEAVEEGIECGFNTVDEDRALCSEAIVCVEIARALLAGIG